MFTPAHPNSAGVPPDLSREADPARGALDLLLAYNREDVVNLEVLMDAAFRMECEQLLALPREVNHLCPASPR